MDLTALQEQLAALTAALPQIQEHVKERAVQEAVAGGAVVRVVPEYFPRPVRAQKGQPVHVDPWFGLTQADWSAEMADGFEGWYKTNEGSGRAKVMINYEAARQWLAAKMSGQQQRRKEAA
jgi:hypothetical protein